MSASTVRRRAGGGPCWRLGRARGSRGERHTPHGDVARQAAWRHCRSENGIRQAKWPGPPDPRRACSRAGQSCRAAFRAGLGGPGSAVGGCSGGIRTSAGKTAGEGTGGTAARPLCRGPWRGHDNLYFLRPGCGKRGQFRVSKPIDIGRMCGPPGRPRPPGSRDPRTARAGAARSEI